MNLWKLYILRNELAQLEFTLLLLQVLIQCVLRNMTLINSTSSYVRKCIKYN